MMSFIVEKVQFMSIEINKKKKSYKNIALLTLSCIFITTTTTTTIKSNIKCVSVYKAKRFSQTEKEKTIHMRGSVGLAAAVVAALLCLP